MDTPSREAQYDSIITNFRQMLDSLQESIPAGRLSALQIKKLIDGLPRIEEKKLIEIGEKDSLCPICFTPYLTILTEEEMASAMDTPAHPVEELGVTKLAQSWQCGHMFCRRDISKWITSGHDSCPMCRRLLVEAQEPSSEAGPEASQQNEHVWDSNLSNAMAGIQRIFMANNRAIPDGFEGLFNEFDANLRTTGRTEADEDERHEYSGMYS